MIQSIVNVSAALVVSIIVLVSGLLILIKKAYKVHQKGYVLITGASVGIGLHAAVHLASRHGFIVLAGVRKEKDAEKIRHMNIKNLQPIIVDVNQHDSCVKCIDKIRSMSRDSGLHLVALVNNAGVNRHLPLEFNPVEDAKEVFNTNVFGVMEMIQQCLPLLRESKGRIVNISSVSGFIAVPSISVYSASKFAVEGLSDALRRELSHMGISVSVVQPAFVKATNLHEATESMSMELVKDPEIAERMKKLYARFFGAASAKKIADVMRRAATPVVTSTAIEDAICARYPKTRYPVSNSNGVPSMVLSWLFWFANDRLNDVLIEYK